MATIFPSLTPSQLNQAWFPETDQIADESVISIAEDAYEAWKRSISHLGAGSIHYGGLLQHIFLELLETSSVYIYSFQLYLVFL